MKNIRKLFNFNIGPCLAGLFSRQLRSKGSAIIIKGCLFLSIFISFFGALFAIGNPYLSLSIMFVLFCLSLLEFF